MSLWIGLGLAGRLGCCLERALLLQVMCRVCARGALLPMLWWKGDWGLHSHNVYRVLDLVAILKKPDHK